MINLFQTSDVPDLGPSSGRSGIGLFLIGKCGLVGFKHWCSKPTRGLFGAKTNETGVGWSSFE